MSTLGRSPFHLLVAVLILLAGLGGAAVDGQRWFG